MAETLYKASNSAVKIASTVIPRVQDFSIDTDRQSEAEYELGNLGPAGTSVGSWSYSGRMSFHPISTLAELAWTGLTATPTAVIKLADIMTATPVAITAPGMGLTGAVVTAIEYSVSVPNGKWACSMDFKGTGITGITTVAAPAVAGAGAWRAKHIFARFEGLASALLRVKSLRMRAGYTAEDLYQLSSADPFAIDNMQPTVTVDVEWYWVTESTNPGTNATDLRPIWEENSGTDLEVQMVPTGLASDWDDVGNIRVMLQNLTTTRRGASVAVGSQGTHSIGYTSGGDATTYGWTVDVIGT
jgi:hypothetical protein